MNILERFFRNPEGGEEEFNSQKDSLKLTISGEEIHLQGLEARAKGGEEDVRFEIESTKRNIVELNQELKDLLESRRKTAA